MSTKLSKTVVDGKAFVTLAECVYIGDGTSQTVKDVLNVSSDVNKYKGKTILWLGDSISVSNNPSYPQKVCASLGATLINKASSGGDDVRMRKICQGDGTTQDQWGNTYPTIDFSNIDVVFIMIGHNCSTNLIKIEGGTSTIDDIPVDDTDFKDFVTTSFYCNVGSCIEFMQNKNSNIEIILLTPLQSNNAVYIRSTSIAKKALYDLADFYSLRIIDVHGRSGIYRKNASLYTTDGTHPNNIGTDIIRDVILNGLNK